MTLAAGAKLAHYEIVSSIGRGGMGEVYRARDTKLGRDVAIKVLREELAGDPERVARFEREAKLLASLAFRAEAAGTSRFAKQGFFLATSWARRWIISSGPGRRTRQGSSNRP